MFYSVFRWLWCVSARFWEDWPGVLSFWAVGDGEYEATCMVEMYTCMEKNSVLYDFV